MQDVTTQELVDIVQRYDDNDRSVSIDQYDDAIEQLAELSDEGDSMAQEYFDSIS